MEILRFIKSDHIRSIGFVSAHNNMKIAVLNSQKFEIELNSFVLFGIAI